MADLSTGGILTYHPPVGTLPPYYPRLPFCYFLMGRPGASLVFVLPTPLPLTVEFFLYSFGV